MANVSIRELAIDFGSVSVLKSLNLEIQSGEFIVLLGPSGCGKSTLLNAIAGLTDITDGQIWIGDRNVTWEEPKDRGIGMVFQSYALYPTMTVEGNLSFGLRIAGMPKDEIAQRVDRAVQILQIDPLRKRRPGELSGGQRQRVAIGRALVRDVDVFLFDEPLSNLDAKLRTELRVELKRLHSGLGSTMIYVTHDQIEALTLADRIAVMSGGVIQQFATPKEIYRRPVNRFVAGFVGSPSMNFLSGQVTSNGGVPAFILPDGRAIDLNGYEFSGTPGEGRKATLGVRPEQMQFQPASGRAASLPATFTIVEPMGSDNLIWGQVGSETLSVRIDADEDVALDTEQPVYFQPALASLFGEDGQRL
ncbi:ATP-binding cassette domain-containing protein [Rhizobium sp. CNPSo 4039]|uniref:ABC transporter ATP-binding protein n=1 Tax=Rhizobium sp. CNPSo 4039 TaxID=3021409 RepID=UPI00254E25A9|nr:ATP-binding cassette domain-containing protein [Rhizobium sp. CNPSo 4039]MDK4712505.1 ATP-binding cassette domain-containing protein [Rhizobium sp. CNPSo 4039]